MKPFNLEQALAGAPVITRYRRDVKLSGINVGALDKNNVLLGLVTDEDGCIQEMGWGIDGSYLSTGVSSTLDLFMKPRIEKRTVWVNVYKDSRDDGMFHIKSAADRVAHSSRINCVELTYEVEID